MENSIKNQNKYFFTQVLLRITYFLLPVVFLLFGCEKDTNDSLSDNSISFSKDFNSASFKNVIPYVFDVDWQNPQEVISDTIPTPFYEFPVTNSNLDITEIQMRHKERNISIQYKVIAIPNEDVSYDYYMVKFTSFSPYGGKVSFNDLTGFSGRISFYDTDGSSLSKSIYDGGMLVQSIFEKGTNKASFTGKEDVLECTLETIPVFTDWYYDRGSYYEYAYTEIKYESKWVCGSSGGTAPESGGNSQGFINDGTHGGGSGGNSSSGYPEFNDEVIGEDHIHLVDEVNNPCVKDIIDKLQNKDMQRLTIPDIGGLDGTGHLSQGILDLFDKSGNYDLTFKVAEAGKDLNGNPRNASTQPSGDGWSVTLDDDYVGDATQLSIARTIIHESIHAYIGYILKENRTSDMVTDLNLINEKYKNEINNYNLTQHEFISQYVDALANSLAVWDNRFLDSGYYKKLAWAGLESSSVYNTLKNKSEIQTAIRNEATSSNNAEGVKCD